jgi:hypothetical protein
MKKGNLPYLLLIGLIAFILFTGFAISEEPSIWYDRGDGNIVLTDPNNNVIIGSNETTEYKLYVNGTTYCNDTVTLSKYMNIGESINFSKTSDQIGIRWTEYGGITYVSFPITLLGSTRITFPYGTYDVIASTNTQTISGQKTFSNSNTYFSQYLKHMNNPTTHIMFGIDNIVFTCGGNEILDLTEVGSFPNQAVFNEDGESFEFRIELDNEQNALFLSEDKGLEINVNILSYENISCLKGFYPPSIVLGPI